MCIFYIWHFHKNLMYLLVFCSMFNIARTNFMFLCICECEAQRYLTFNIATTKLIFLYTYECKAWRCLMFNIATTKLMFLYICEYDALSQSLLQPTQLAMQEHLGRPRNSFFSEQDAPIKQKNCSSSDQAVFCSKKMLSGFSQMEKSSTNCMSYSDNKIREKDASMKRAVCLRGVPNLKNKTSECDK